MVTGARIAFAIAVAFGGASGAAALGACKVVNTDHCANKDDPGNDWCRALSTSTPFCSPCEREFHGCVSTEPFACPGYVAVIDNGDDPQPQGSGGMTAGMTTAMTEGMTAGAHGGTGDGADANAGSGGWGAMGEPADLGAGTGG